MNYMNYIFNKPKNGEKDEHHSFKSYIYLDLLDPDSDADAMWPH